MSSVVLVTGASSGVGALTADALASAGHTVYASMRDISGRNAERAAAVRELAVREGIDLRVVELDVLSQDSADRAVATVLREAGRLDVLAHNAGHMVLGPAEAFTPEEPAAVYDTNVLGTQRVNRAALPRLRAQGHGLLLWVGSSSTRGGTPPYLAPYFAAKAAMDALAVSYARPLRRRHLHRRPRRLHLRHQPLRQRRPPRRHARRRGLRDPIRGTDRPDRPCPGRDHARRRRRGRGGT